MKEFRKWWKKHRASTSPHTCQSAREENLAQMADAEVWKATLEWLLSKPLCGWSKDIVKKELESDT